MRTFFLYVLLWPLAGVFAQVAGPPEATPAKTSGGSDVCRTGTIKFPLPSPKTVQLSVGFFST